MLHENHKIFAQCILFEQVFAMRASIRFGPSEFGWAPWHARRIHVWILSPVAEFCHQDRIPEARQNSGRYDVLDKHMKQLQQRSFELDFLKNLNVQRHRAGEHAQYAE